MKRLQCHGCSRESWRTYALQRGRLVQQVEGPGLEFIFDESEGRVSQALLCEDCSDEVVMWIQDMTDDLPPISCENDDVAGCLGCASDILEAEATYRVLEVKVELSRRTGAPLLQPAEDPEDAGFLCLSCAHEVFRELERENADAALQVDTSENGECVSCTLSRCWRVPGCACRCHGER